MYLKNLLTACFKDQLTGATTVAIGASLPIIPLAVIGTVLVIDGIAVTANAARAAGRGVADQVKNRRVAAENRRNAEIAEISRIARAKQQAEYERLRPQRQAETKEEAIKKLIADYNAVVRAAEKIADESLRYEAIGEAEIRLRMKLDQML